MKSDIVLSTGDTEVNQLGKNYYFQRAYVLIWQMVSH